MITIIYKVFYRQLMEPRIYVTQPSQSIRNKSQQRKPKFSIQTRISIGCQNPQNFQQIITSFRNTLPIESSLKINEPQFPGTQEYTHKKATPGNFVYDCIISMEQKMALQRQRSRCDIRVQSAFNNNNNLKLKLKLRIPQTIVFENYDHTMIYFDQSDGIVKIKRNIVFSDFYDLIAQKIKNFKQNPPFIMKLSSKGVQFQKEVILKNDANEKLIIKGRKSEILTRFIYPCNNTPNLMRVFFIPKQTKKNTKTYALRYSNKRKIDNFVLGKTHKLLHNTLVNTQKEQSYYKHLIKGNSLRTYEEMCQSLVDFIEVSQKVKIYEMVVDFITDQHKVPWFSQIKFIKSKNLTNVWSIGSPQQIIVISKQKNHALKCPVCQLDYSKHQIKKIVTNKLIHELIAHLKLRGINVNQLFIRMETASKLSHQGSSRVCELCYDIITAEHELINTQHKYCKLINIKPNQIERIRASNSNYGISNQKSEFVQKPQQQFKQMKQWRLMLFVQNIKNIPDQDNLLSNSVIGLQMEFKGKMSKFDRLIYCDHGYCQKQKQKPEKSKKLASKITDFKRNLQSSQLKKMSKYQISSKYKLQKRLNQTQTQASSYQHQILHNYCLERIATQVKQKSLEKIRNKSKVNVSSFKKEIYNKSFSYCKAINAQNRQLFQRKNSKVNISINEIKIIQFYTNQQDISKFLQNASVDFVLDIVEKQKQSLKQRNFSIQNSLVGTTPVIQSLINRTSSQRTSLEVYLFDNKKNSCSLQMTVGLICDGQTAVYQRDLVSMDCYSKCYVYRSDKNPVIGTCKPLPDQWMELFTSQIPMKPEEVDNQIMQMLSLLTSPAIEPSSKLLRQTSIDSF